MRLLIWLLIVALYCGATLPAWAQEPESTANEQQVLSPQATAVSRLLDKGLEQNFDAISQQAMALSQQEREVIFEQRQKHLGVPIILNLLVGFGIGSLMSGDSTVGFGLMSADLLTFGLLVLAVSSDIAELEPPQPVDPNGHRISIGKVSIAVAGIVFLFSKLFGLAAPISFADVYNERLRKALGFLKEISETSRGLPLGEPLVTVGFAF